MEVPYAKYLEYFAYGGTGPGVQVVDTPYLSSPPKGLIALLTAMSSKMEGQKLLQTAKAPSLLFVDICKELLASFPAWQIVGAQATYNPLGQMVTFLSKDDIISKADRLSAIREGGMVERELDQSVDRSCKEDPFDQLVHCRISAVYARRTLFFCKKVVKMAHN